MSLIDDARLTDEERDMLFRTKIVTGGILQREPVIERLFSNAAAAKALWAAYDFLDGLCMAPNEGWRACSQEFYEVLIEAGIERPILRHHRRV